MVDTGFEILTEYVILLDNSLLAEILTILLKQPSKPLQELFDKQQNMTHVAKGLFQGLLLSCLIKIYVIIRLLKQDRLDAPTSLWGSY